jgi:hypothetical protein
VGKLKDASVEVSYDISVCYITYNVQQWSLWGCGRTTHIENDIMKEFYILKRYIRYSVAGTGRDSSVGIATG